MVVSHWSSREMASYSFTWDAQGGGGGGNGGAGPTPGPGSILVPSPTVSGPQILYMCPSLPEEEQREGAPSKAALGKRKDAPALSGPASLFDGWETGLEL